MRRNYPSSSLPIGRNHSGALIGRDSEREILHELLTSGELFFSPEAKSSAIHKAVPLDTQRRPQCVLLMGEAGIGKTRLAEDVSQLAQQRGWSVLWSRSYTREGSIPYRLWTELLRSALDSKLLPIDHHPDEYAPLTALLPELYDLLPVNKADRAAISMQASLSLHPEQEQQRLREAVLAFFQAASEESPLLLVLDDLQWADTSSCDLLAYLVRRLSGFPILFIGTCRENEVLDKSPLRVLIAHMQREHTITTLSLAPLTAQQVGHMVAHLPQTMVQYIRAQAAGNPFFAEELAHSITTSPAFHTAAQELNPSSPLPQTITAALASRVSQLSTPCQQLLANAAVLGGSFAFDLICSMESADTSANDEDAVLDLLDEALQAGVLLEEGRGMQVTYSFWHPLVVSHLYEQLATTRRSALHRRVASILQALPARREEAQAATITHHLVAGRGEPAKIAHYAGMAAHSAYTLSAYPEAEKYYRLVVEHTRANTMDERVHLAFLLERLAECMMVRGKFEEARHLYERVLEERHTLSPHTPPAAIAYEAQIDALLWCEIGWTWRYMGNTEQTSACRVRGEDILTQAKVRGGPAWARLRYQQGSIYWQEGKYEKAQQAAKEALALFEQIREQQEQQLMANAGEGRLTRTARTLAGDKVDLARIHRLLGTLAYSVGQPADALAHFNTALNLFEAHDQLREVAHLCCNIGYVHLKAADYFQAQSFLNRSLQLAGEVGDEPLTSVVFSNLAELAFCQGEMIEAEKQFRQSLLLAERFNDREYMSRWNSGLASVFQQQGRIAEAATCIHMALAIGRSIHNTPCIGLALVALGKMRIAQAKAIDGAEEQRGRILARAQATLNRALALPELESETRSQGTQALEEARMLLKS